MRRARPRSDSSSRSVARPSPVRRSRGRTGCWALAPTCRASVRTSQERPMHLRFAATTPLDINISPNSDGLPGIGQLRGIVGASMTVGLILAVLALIVSAIVWALGANSSNPHLAGRGKFGVLVGLGAAIITGASVALVNFFWNVGQAV